MPDIRHFEHVHIRVEDLQKCLDFYTDVMGLVKLGEADGVHYLGCGMDDRYDLAVSQGDAAVEHFAIRIPGGKDELDRYYHQLNQAGVDAYWVSDAEPGHPYAVRFRLPNRVTMELVNVEIPRYQRMDRPARRDRSVVAPLDADHITLQAINVRETAEFLRDVLGFRITDVSLSQAGLWRFAWARLGPFHHDVGIGPSNHIDQCVNHIAWTMANFEHMKLLLDRLGEARMWTEYGPGRHLRGGNLFFYILEPGGNRFEFSAEMALISDETPTLFYEYEEGRKGNSVWSNADVPDTFFVGSKCVELGPEIAARKG